MASGLPPIQMRLFLLTDKEHYLIRRLGGGDFGLGLRYLHGLTPRAPLILASQRRKLPESLTEGPHQRFPECIDAETAERLGRWGGTWGERARSLLDTVWHLIPSAKREDLLAQFQARAHEADRAVLLPRPDGFWYTRGQVPGRQTQMRDWDEE